MSSKETQPDMADSSFPLQSPRLVVLVDNKELNLEKCGFIWRTFWSARLRTLLLGEKAESCVRAALKRRENVFGDSEVTRGASECDGAAAPSVPLHKPPKSLRSSSCSSLESTSQVTLMKPTTTPSL